MLRKFSAVFSIIFFLLLLSQTASIQHAFAARLLAPGTRCDLSSDNRISNVCGNARSALSEDYALSDGQTATGPGRGLGGVSVYLYECDPTSPTCKVEGNLTLLNNAFSSTYTTDETGWYEIPMRKVGAYQLRYIVFACNGTVAGIQKIRSYQSLELNPILNCPPYNSYIPPPKKLNYIDKSPLSCDMQPAFSGGPVAMEVSYGETKPSTLLNLDITVKDGDPRFATLATDPQAPILAVAGNDGNVDGAWWHLDCMKKYSGVSRQLCMGGQPDVNGTRQKYEDALYANPAYLVQNKLPNIPPSNSILFYKELTPRQDITEYSQSPTKPAQFLQTQFGNCVGQVYLRKFGEKTQENIVDCSAFKSCNAAIGDGDRNRQYSSGPMKGLANPSIFQTKFEADADLNAVVCKVDGGTCTLKCDSPTNPTKCWYEGDCIKLGQIQPSWSLCHLGEGGCNYKYDKTYFNPEIMYFHGLAGTPSKYPLGFETTNDSYGSSQGAGLGNTFTNEVPWQPTKEAQGVPAQGGTFITGTNPLGNSNNSLFAPMGGLVSNSLGGGKIALSYVLDRPFESPDDKMRYTSGEMLMDLDPGVAHCIKSNVNKDLITGAKDLITNVLTETRNGNIYRNSMFQGVLDHWFKDLSLSGAELVDISGTAQSKKTATSGRYFTTPAKNRAIELNRWAPNLFTLGVTQKFGFIDYSSWAIMNRDFVDSVLTTTYGPGKITVTSDSILAAILSVVQKFLDKTENKTFIDRKSTAPEQLMDDIKADFTLSEENFMSLFPLPTRFDSNWLETDDWGKDNQCYPWKTVLPTKASCGTAKEDPSNPGVETQDPQAISRTCRVEACNKKQTIVRCDCEKHSDGSVSGPDNCDDKDVVDVDGGGACAHAWLDPYNDRLRCAQTQTTCMDDKGKVDEDCLKLTFGIESPLGNIVDSAKPKCEDQTYPSCCTNPPGGWNKTEDVEVTNPATGEVTIETKYSCEGCKIRAPAPHRTPACTDGIAGPFTCPGMVLKSTDFKVQNQNINEDNKLYLDPMKTVDNMYQQLIPPFMTSKFYIPGANVSAKTSIVPKEQEPQVNMNEALHKDITGFGSGAAAEYKQIAAHPIDFAPSMPISNSVQFWCTSELGAGAWSCPILPVPNPEFIDINALLTDGRNGYSSAENVLGADQTAYTPSHTSYLTFWLNAAASFPFIKSNAQIPALAAGGYCSLNPSDDCKRALGIPEADLKAELSSPMLHIMDAAAQKFSIPAVVLAEYLGRIGKIGSYRYFWSQGGAKSLIDASSPWYGTIAECDDVNAAEQGAYDLFQTGFNGGLKGPGDATGACAALEELSQGRCKTASRCNFLDSTYVVAAILKTMGPQSGGCGWTYAQAKAALYTLTWGSDRKVGFANDPWYENAPGPKIWDACK